MAEITFYHQERKDGGLRTGLQANGQTFLHTFHEGAAEYDPGLVWYLDIRCSGSVPELTSPEEVRDWLSQSSGMLHQALDAAIEELSGGLDADFRPWDWTYAGAPEGITIRVVVSAMRRLAGIQVAEKLRHLSQNWDTYLQELQSLVPA